MGLKKNVQLRGKNQITIPTTITEELQLKEGEDLEVSIQDGRIILTPVITIEKDQAWFWTKEWQQDEREAEEDIEAGHVSEKYVDIDKLFDDIYNDGGEK